MARPKKSTTTTKKTPAKAEQKDVVEKEEELPVEEEINDSSEEVETEDVQEPEKEGKSETPTKKKQLTDEEIDAIALEKSKKSKKLPKSAWTKKRRVMIDCLSAHDRKIKALEFSIANRFFQMDFAIPTAMDNEEGMELENIAIQYLEDATFRKSVPVTGSKNGETKSVVQKRFRITYLDK